MAAFTVYAIDLAAYYFLADLGLASGWHVSDGYAWSADYPTGEAYDYLDNYYGLPNTITISSNQYWGGY